MSGMNLSQKYKILAVPSELRSCVKVEVDVLGSRSLTVLTVSVDIKQHCGHKATLNRLRAQELCESRGGRPGLPVLNSP